jgi:predicted amidophosphoribosyltransferase
LRISKNPNPDPDERAAVFRLAGWYFCRFVAERTSVLTVADVVVPIPADPDRFVQRMASLPDELAQAVQAQLAIPVAKFALQKIGSNVEMKRLSRAERWAAAAEAYAPGRDRKEVAGRCVLLVDDVITSGATTWGAASVLRDVGADDVVAVALSHTEG